MQRQSLQTIFYTINHKRDKRLNIDIVILAAGKGTRMKSSLPKVLHPIAKKSMVAHVVETVESLLSQQQGKDEASNIHLIVGHGSERVKEALTKDFNYIDQAEQLGTGHAVAQALDSLQDNSKTLILYGDVPLTQLKTLETMLEACSEN